MLIVGAGGFAAQLFDDLTAMTNQEITFWSETETKYSFIREKYKILKTDSEVADYFNNVSALFVSCVGIGDIEVRKKMSEKFLNLGGKVTSFISPDSTISQFSSVGTGSIILRKVFIEPGVSIGKECIFNVKSNAAHGCSISSYCQIGPAAILTGEVEIGENSYVGTGAIILPKVKIGKNVSIAAGSLVKKNVPDNAVVSGNPAVIKFFKKT